MLFSFTAASDRQTGYRARMVLARVSGAPWRLASPEAISVESSARSTVSEIAGSNSAVTFVRVGSALDRHVGHGGRGGLAQPELG
jgi:hypothetical protein